jgi:hypothetical protein
MDSENNGSSKHRRQQLNKGVEQLKKAIPLSQEDSNKLSQLQTLHYACIYMRKQILISNLKETNTFQKDDLLKNIMQSQNGISDAMHGFIIGVSRSGHLVYVSDNVINYLGHTSIDVLLSADKFCDILHPLDEQSLKRVLESNPKDSDKQFEFYSSWYVSKIRRRVYNRSDTKIKITGHFINNDLFVALCTPMLRIAEREFMDHFVSSSPNCFTSVHSLDLRFSEICEKGRNILGYSEMDLRHVSLYDLANFKNLKDLRKNHKSLLSNKSQRGKLEKIEILMKNGTYLNCLVNMHYGPNNYIICRFQIFNFKEMSEYDNYSVALTNYASNFSSDDASDDMSFEQQSNDGEHSSSARKRCIDEIGDDYLNDEELISSSSSSSSPFSSDNDEVLQDVKPTSNKKRKSKVEPVIQPSYYSTAVNQNVQSPTYQNTIITSPQYQTLMVEKKISNPSFGHTYFHHNLSKNNSVSNQILQEFTAEITNNNQLNPIYSEYTEWAGINIEDLLPFSDDEILFVNSHDSDYYQQQDTKFYGMTNNSYQFTQDHFLDDIISMIDENCQDIHSHYKR